MAEDVGAAGELDHLRQPVPGAEGRLDPLGEEHASAWQPAHRVGGRLDRLPHLRHDLLAAVDGAQRRRESPDRLGDVGERSWIEREHLRCDRACGRQLLLETAQTAQRSCVTIRSGASASIRSASTVYSDSPSPTDSRTAWSISRLVRVDGSILAAVTTGFPTTSGGQRHSSETPTSESINPSCAMISVALGNSEQIRMRGR